MYENDMPKLDKPKSYRNSKSKLNGFRNMVYKMVRDNINPILIEKYVFYKGFIGSERSIEHLIERISKNNFNKNLHINTFNEYLDVPWLITIKRNDLLKFITTKNPKTKKDKNIEKYISLIKDKYPIINEIINVYDDFYNIFKEKNEILFDEFVNKYEMKEKINPDSGEVIEVDDNIENVKSGIQGFIKSIKKDIAPVKAAISFNESSGFVEGNNNKFKLIKRILYGRCNLVNLFKKCFSIFSLKSSNNIFEFLNFYRFIPNQA